MGADRNPQVILFFDGVCSLCNEFIDFLMRVDTSRTIHFAPLQGETARRELPPTLREELKTLVLLDNGKVYTQSSAALRSLIKLGGVWRLFALELLIPPILRDAAYRLIAKNRYRLFGKRDTCRMPSDDERNRILP